MLFQKSVIERMQLRLFLVGRCSVSTKSSSATLLRVEAVPVRSSLVVDHLSCYYFGREEE